MTNGTSAPDPERRPGEDRAAQIERELRQFLAADVAPGRCGYYSMDPEVTRYPRDDGWRCGLTEGHPERHILYRSHGESIQWTNGEWMHGVN